MPRQRDGVDQVWALIEAIRIAMVVTHDGRGDELRARPMAAHPDPQQNAIFFLTDARSGKIGEVVDKDDVCLAFADARARDYLSVTGEASLSNDRALIQALWSSSEGAFWRDANDPAIRVLRVDPVEAEYWRGPGILTGYVKRSLAGLSDRKREFRETQKVLLSGSRGSRSR